MWISRKEFQELKDRIAELERGQNLTVYESWVTPYGCRYADVKKISHSMVIQEIMTHVGLELKYEEGKPDRVVVEKKSKK